MTARGRVVEVRVACSAPILDGSGYVAGGEGWSERGNGHGAHVLTASGATLW